MQEQNHLVTAYEKVCDSRQAIEDLRSKLLGFLPLASGAGIFFLLNDAFTDGTKRAFFIPYALPVGLLGAAITIGLFLYELRLLQLSHSLKETGRRLEDDLHVIGAMRGSSGKGRYRFALNNTIGSSIIYSAVLAGWIFLASFSFPLIFSGIFSAIIFVIAVTLAYSVLYAQIEDSHPQLSLDPFMIQALQTIGITTNEQLKQFLESKSISSKQPLEQVSES